MSYSNSIAQTYMTIGQAASYLDVNRITIRRWIQSGKLKGEKIGKVTLILKTDIFAIAYQSEIKHDSQ